MLLVRPPGGRDLFWLRQIQRKEREIWISMRQISGIENQIITHVLIRGIIAE